MGSNISNKGFRQQNWQIIEKQSQKLTYRNKQTGSLMQRHQCFQYQQIKLGNTSQTIYTWWTQTQKNINLPKIYHFQVTRSLLDRIQKQHVYTEHLTKLNNVEYINKFEAFFILEHVIKILPNLYHMFGPFFPNNNTININDEGYIRLWINKNLSKIKPDPIDIVSQYNNNSEQLVVNKLIQTIRLKVIEKQTYPKYPNSLNFIETLNYIERIKESNPKFRLQRINVNKNIQIPNDEININQYRSAQNYNQQAIYQSPRKINMQQNIENRKSINQQATSPIITRSPMQYQVFSPPQTLIQPQLPHLKQPQHYLQGQFPINQQIPQYRAIQQKQQVQIIRPNNGISSFSDKIQYSNLPNKEQILPKYSQQNYNQRRYATNHQHLYRQQNKSNVPPKIQYNQNISYAPQSIQPKKYQIKSIPEIKYSQTTQPTYKAQYQIINNNNNHNRQNSYNIQNSPNLQDRPNISSPSYPNNIPNQYPSKQINPSFKPNFIKNNQPKQSNIINKIQPNKRQTNSVQKRDKSFSKLRPSLGNNQQLQKIVQQPMDYSKISNKIQKKSIPTTNSQQQINVQLVQSIYIKTFQK